MRAKEKDALCELIAQWDWLSSGGDSSSGAAARSACAQELIRAFALTEADLSFHRCFAIANLYRPPDDDEFFDALCDLYERIGYEALVDIIEEHRTGCPDVIIALAAA